MPIIMINKSPLTWLFYLLLLLPGVLIAETYTGKVVHISDGDTLKILVDRQQLKIRLAEIDTPEKGQPYGKKANSARGHGVWGNRTRG